MVFWSVTITWNSLLCLRVGGRCKCQHDTAPQRPHTFFTLLVVGDSGVIGLGTSPASLNPSRVFLDWTVVMISLIFWSCSAAPPLPLPARWLWWTESEHFTFFIGGGDPVHTSEVRHLCVFRSFGTMSSEGAEWKVGREHTTWSVDWSQKIYQF